MNTQIYMMNWFLLFRLFLFVMGQVMWRDSSWVNLVSLPLSEKDKYLLVYLKHITYPQLMCINNNIHFRQATRKIDTKSGRNLVGMSHMCEQNIFEGTSSSSKSELLLVSLHYINDDKMSSSSLQKYITSIKSSFVVFLIYYKYTLQCMGTIQDLHDNMQDWVVRLVTRSRKSYKCNVSEVTSHLTLSHSPYTHYFIRKS